jgi:hypothetical protein
MTVKVKALVLTLLLGVLALPLLADGRGPEAAREIRASAWARSSTGGS